MARSHVCPDVTPARPDAVASHLSERAATGRGYGTLELPCIAIAYHERPETQPDREPHPAASPPRPAPHPRHRSPPGHPLILFVYASPRPGELSVLRHDDLATRPDGLLVTVRRANGDPEAPGHVIGVTHGPHAVTDPIAALTDWTRHHSRLIGTLFLRMPITFGERRCRAAD